MSISKAWIKDPAEPDDTRSDMDIVHAIGKSMQRVTRPRNALDVIGMTGAPAFHAAPNHYVKNFLEPYKFIV